MNTIGSERMRSQGIGRKAFLAGGLLFMGLGLVGAFLPVLPTTVFFILALWCFKRSNRTLERWLLEHRLFGAALRDWEQSRSLTLKTKLVAIASLWACVAVTIALTREPLVAAVLVAVGFGVSAYLVTRPTKVAAASGKA